MRELRHLGLFLAGTVVIIGLFVVYSERYSLAECEEVAATTLRSRSGNVAAEVSCRRDDTTSAETNMGAEYNYYCESLTSQVYLYVAYDGKCSQIFADFGRMK